MIGVLLNSGMVERLSRYFSLMASDVKLFMSWRSPEPHNGIVRSILHFCAYCPAVFVLEGGYDIPSLCDSVKITIEEMLK